MRTRIVRQRIAWLPALAVVVSALALPPVAAAGEGDHDGSTGALADVERRGPPLSPTAEQKELAAALGARVTWNHHGTPHTVVRDGGDLGRVSADTAAAAARAWLADNAGLFRLASAEALELVAANRLPESDGFAVLFRHSSARSRRSTTASSRWASPARRRRASASRSPRRR